MIPGEIFPAKGILILNEGAISQTLMVENKGDRPVQVGSHYHFGEANSALKFDREKALGMRLDIVAGTAIRFEPGQRRCKCQLKLRDLNILQCLGQPSAIK